MRARKSVPLALLSLTLLCLPSARATQTAPKAPRPRPNEDELARHLSAAETFQLSGDMAGAEAENRAVVAVALRRLGALAAREGDFAAAVKLLAESVAALDDAEARTNLAIAHMRLLQIEPAVSAAQAALQLDAKNARAHHVLGKLLYMKGDYAGALTHLERAVVIEPDLDAAYTLGMTYLRLKQLERAKLLFEEMQQAAGRSGGIHALFGRAYEDAGYPAEAEREFRQALTVDPQTPRAHFYLGYVIMLHGGSERLAEASAEFDRELQQHPDDFYSNFFRGMLAATVEADHARAVRHLSEAVRVRPEMAEAYLYLGQSQAELGLPEAEKSLRLAIRLTTDPTHNSFQVKKAHFLLGRVLLKAGRREEAEQEMGLARELQGRSLESSRQELGEILGRVERPAGDASSPTQVAAAEAKPSAAPSAAADSTDPGGEVLLIEAPAPGRAEAAKYQAVKDGLARVLAQAFHNLGVIAAQRGDPAAGAEQFAAAARWRPDLPGLDRNWGIVSFRAAQYERAVAPLARHLRAHPDDALVRRMLGVSLYLTKDFAGAVETLKPLEASVTDDAELAYTYGVALAQTGERAGAARVFTRLAEGHARDAQARFYAAQGFALTGDYERALAELRAAAGLDPRMAGVHYAAGQGLIRLNRLEEAEREFREELKLNPSDAAAKYHLAYVLLELKRQTPEALALLRETVASRPDYADARYQLGKALVEQGDARAAVEQLEAAARISPGVDYIHYQLSVAYRRLARAGEAERELQIYRELKASNRTRETPAGGAGARPDVP